MRLTNVKRVRRHLATSMECTIYRDEEEDIDHILRYCAKTFGSGSTSSSMNWGMKFLIWCWLLWKLCCCMVFDVDFLERERVFEKGCRLSVECECTFGLFESMQTTEPRRRLCWVAPARGCVKLNVNVVVCQSDGQAATNRAFRDDMGGWLFGFSRFVGRCPVLIAELWALYDGLQNAWALNF
ncbi:hypothetical protein V6N11_039556 [Hibiscus sabdariffa]|uniref:RNase H type-1 domain-containing protein n=1 Tax=Hibiscus sabdariffa TaxID=183260 RepID=A0ABR2SP61_9ROSI